MYIYKLSTTDKKTGINKHIYIYTQTQKETGKTDKPTLIHIQQRNTETNKDKKTKTHIYTHRKTEKGRHSRT